MPSTNKANKRTRDALEQQDAGEPVAGPSSSKGKIYNQVESEEDDDEEEDSDLDEDEDDDEEDNKDDDDDEDIRQANEDAQTRPKKKRKRALPSNAFGSLLSSLVAAPIPTKPLRPLHPPPSAEALEKKALKQLQAKKHEREERGHVSDIIAGWTPRPNIPFSQWAKLEKKPNNNDDGKGPTGLVEYFGDNVGEMSTGGAEKERELRRLAQKGAVRLFNAIKAAQSTAEDIEAGGSGETRTAAIKNESAAARRAIKEGSPAGSVISNASKATTAGTDATGSVVAGDRKGANLLGSRGKQEALANLSKASFLELFKTGSGGGAFAKPKLPA